MHKAQIRSGAYYDSVVLMQLQRALADLPGVDEAGVVMGTPANKELLADSDLLTDDARAASTEDLIIAVRARDEATASDALGQVDALLQRRATSTTSDYRPKSLSAAAKSLPDAQWVLVSVPGRHAAAVAREALDLGKHVFLYSDNVSLKDEVALKQRAASKGLLVMGPDCGTAIVGGVGLGFANRVRRGPIGLVAASGTGLQHVATSAHALGSGISHALGTGGRDLSSEVRAIVAAQALDLLAADADTHVIVLISKPPADAVADALIRRARQLDKPVVVNFIGYEPPSQQLDANGNDNVHFASTLQAAAERAVQLAEQADEAASAPADKPVSGFTFAPAQRYLRGLYSGGTLSYEALLLLRDALPHTEPEVWSNAPLDADWLLDPATASRAHTVVDLGADEFTVGRLHPMLDNDLRVKRIAQEAADPEVAVLLLDVVLGDGTHPDPASELAPAVHSAIDAAQGDGRALAVIAAVIGTEVDPQNVDEQVAALEGAGALVERSNEAAVRRAAAIVAPLNAPPPVDPNALHNVAAINVGVELFAHSLRDQGAPVIHVDWRPPAGGNEKLAGILARMRGG